jgi:NADH dehydrogenase [ubiquinone] 1 alpha subcomplex assembly factor 1
MDLILFDFSHPEVAEGFRPIGDRVMGGVSTGRLRPGLGCAVFSGEVSFKNQGGFASVRSEIGSWDLSNFEGVEVLVRGDDRVYQLSLTTDPRYGSVVYRARFTAPSGNWSDVRIPFGEFSPMYRGKTVPGAPPLDPSRISTFGFLISDRQEGKFQLMIRSISAY